MHRGNNRVKKDKESKMIPLAMLNLTGNEKKYLNNCIDTTFVSSVGEYVTKFEENIPLVVDVACAIGATYGGQDFGAFAD